VTAAVVQVVFGGNKANAAAVVSSLAFDAGSKNWPSLSAKIGETFESHDRDSPVSSRDGGLGDDGVDGSGEPG
jgi:hypothetical protein